MDCTDQEKIQCMQDKCDEMMKYFSYEHLPSHLQNVSRPFCELANDICNRVYAPMCQETCVAMRKLLEAKDAAVRAAVE